jgi:hypothetical protein
MEENIMVGEVKKAKLKGVRLLILLLMASAFLWGGCDGCNDDSSSTRRDDDGDVLSDSDTGIKLPQSVQTIPAESTAAKMSRLNAVKGGDAR